MPIFAKPGYRASAGAPLSAALDEWMMGHAELQLQTARCTQPALLIYRSGRAAYARCLPLLGGAKYKADRFRESLELMGALS